MENNALSEFQLDWRAAVAVFVSIFVLIFQRYNRVLSTLVEDLLLYLVLLIILIIFIFRESPREYGFRLGYWKLGLFISLLSIGCISIFVMAFSQSLPLEAYSVYGTEPVPVLLAEYGVEYLFWEFLFRGLLFFGLYRIFGAYAIILQAIPYTLAKFGNPQWEVIGSLFGGPFVGYIAWRTRSFLYPFIIHWYLGAFLALYNG